MTHTPKPPRLLIYEPSYRAIKHRLEGLGIPLTPVVVDEQGAGAGDAELGWFCPRLFGSGAAPAFTEALLGASSLRWVQSSAAGLDNPLFRKLCERGVRLTSSHVQAPAIGDFVLAGVLDHFQQGPVRRKAQEDGEWRRLPFRELGGTSWLIYGFGAIGKAVARRARGFGAQITAVRRSIKPCEDADHVVTVAEAHTRLLDADVVVLAMPLDASTRGFAGEAFFGAMKAGSVLVNVGRGGLVDESALLAALDSGVPAHAILDVFATEPLPEDNPFWSHPHVAVTAHGSSAGSGVVPRNGDLFMENLQRFLDQQALLHEVSMSDFGQA
ncbi:hypothetical protein MB02_07550 [Croceicoccus estronivorus]|uniref:D-2-hydroxyacid dehydrogenase n=1 Tax=Croceicoccus estronivorus TaxID=1172626 RepID=UPI000836532E|nr:D-2-hydroxyacid dehydrogenase [Croceicoccus estronivorus]OCC24424.1 hypothetical protein MB02_07550 [Croceicoccus estronivorus]